MTVRPAGDTRRTPDPVRLQQVLRSLVGMRRIPACAVRVGLVQDFGNVVLFPEEAAAVHRAAPVRLATFRAGRGCARAALTDLGSTEFAIAVASSGAPIWPPGFAGSIAHTNEIAAAVVARSDAGAALGLDIEGDAPLDDATMVQIVCRPEELVSANHAGARQIFNAARSFS
jgi:4'-phosphopantetheinyl transferase EntD